MQKDRLTTGLFFYTVTPDLFRGLLLGLCHSERP